MKPLITDEQAQERFDEMAKHFGKAHRVLVPTTNSLLNIIGLQLDLILYLMQQVEQLKSATPVEDSDDYDYAADDRNFDAARERSWKR